MLIEKAVDSMNPSFDQGTPETNRGRPGGRDPVLDPTSPNLRVRYLLKSRGMGETARAAPEQSVALADELFASLTRAVSERGSLSTHVSAARGEVRQMKMYIDSVLAELLEIHR